MTFGKTALIWFTLVGCFFAAAAEKNNPLVGHWKSTANPDDKIEITKTDFGLDLWTRNGGRGRIASTTQGSR
jgi:hypothetical protein